MVRIYFDKQIFSYLFNHNNGFYESLLELLIANKSNFLYCYSHAHMMDLKSDQTDKKYEELEFMENLVGDNHISYDMRIKATSCFLVKPKEAFEEYERTPKLSTENILEIDTSDLDEEQLRIWTSAKSDLLNLQLDFGSHNFEAFPEYFPKDLALLLTSKGGTLSFTKWMEYFFELLEKMEKDDTVYKNLRKSSGQFFKPNKFQIDYNDIRFDDDIQILTLQKSFKAYVTNSINPSGNRDISEYDYFTSAYFMLDVLNIEQEPIKKVKFKNLINDALHGYYGAHCDCVVSEDKGFLKKIKILYRLLDIKTKVLNAKKLHSSFTYYKNSVELTQNAFFELLKIDIQNSLILGTRSSLERNRLTQTRKPLHQYLGFFNQMEIIIDEGQYFIYLFRKIQNYSRFTFLREIEMITNRSIDIFGYDNSGIGRFKWPEENNKIGSKSWDGRMWIFEDFTIKLEINKGSKDFGLLITFEIDR